MADFSQRSRPSGKPMSLAEMAAQAAQRSTNRPPNAVPVAPSFRPSPLSARPILPPPSARPMPPPPPPMASPGAARGEGSGLIHLKSVSAGPSLAPAVRGINTTPPPAPLQPIEVPDFRGKTRSRAGFWGVAIAVLGLGAGYGVLVGRGTNPVAAAKTFFAAMNGGNQSTSSSQFSVQEERPVKQEPERASPPPVAPKPEGPKGVEIGSLPAVPTVAPSEPTDIVAETKTRPSKAPVRTPVKPEPQAVAVAAGPSPRKAEAEPEPTGLAGAIKKAAGPIGKPAPEPPMTQAAPAAPRGDIPEAPAQGAIQGALGSQRGAARACVAGHDSPSRATIVFASSGKVQSVAVSGPAAGTSAEGCIRSALSKANVGPFQRASFSVSTTISP